MYHKSGDNLQLFFPERKIIRPQDQDGLKAGKLRLVVPRRAHDYSCFELGSLVHHHSPLPAAIKYFMKSLGIKICAAYSV